MRPVWRMRFAGRVVQGAGASQMKIHICSSRRLRNGMMPIPLLTKMHGIAPARSFDGATTATPPSLLVPRSRHKPRFARAGPTTDECTGWQPPSPPSSRCSSHTQLWRSGHSVPKWLPHYRPPWPRPRPHNPTDGSSYPPPSRPIRISGSGHTTIRTESRSRSPGRVILCPATRRSRL